MQFDNWEKTRRQSPARWCIEVTFYVSLRMFLDLVEIYRCILVSVHKNGKIFLQNQTENLISLSKQILQKEICAR